MPNVEPVTLLVVGTNVALELFGFIVSFVIVISILLNNDAQTRKDRLFVATFSLLGFTLLSDAVSWFFEGWPGHFFRIACIGANFASFLSCAILFYFFTAYFMAVVSERTRAGKGTLRLMAVLCIILVIATVVSLFNGMFFCVDENNIYHLGPLYASSLWYVIFLYVINALLILRYRSALGKKDTLIFVSYVILPLIALIIQMFVLDLMLLYVAMMVAMLIVYINIQSQQGKKLKEKEIELNNQQVAIMLSQIQPHFLYNVLTSINDLCENNPEAQEAIIMFSDYLRANMDSVAQKKLIPFKKELEHVRQYLWLEKLRFEDRLQVRYDIKVDEFMIPALTLQPIVENAVRYGITKKRSGGTVWISTEKAGSCFRVVVKDDGAGFDPKMPIQDGRSHIGIPNVQGRLSTMCGGTLIIESTPGKGTTAFIEIPTERGES